MQRRLYDYVYASVMLIMSSAIAILYLFETSVTAHGYTVSVDHKINLEKRCWNAYLHSNTLRCVWMDDVVIRRRRSSLRQVIVLVFRVEKL